MLRTVVLFIALSLTYARFAHAADINLVSDPSTVALKYMENHKSGHLIVSTTADKGLPSFYLRALSLRSGDTFASVSFPTNGGRDFIEFAEDSGQRRTIPIELTGLDTPGAYEGLIELSTQGQPSVFTKVIAVRAAANFAFVLGGSAFKEGRIEFVGSGRGSQAMLTIQIPTTAQARSVELDFKPPLSGRLTAVPSHFSLLPGAPKIITLRDDGLDWGTGIGIMTIGDTTDRNLVSEVAVSATNQWYFDKKTALLFLLVLMGALLSALLNNVFPFSLGKRQIREELTNAESVINACVGVGKPLQSMLLQEAARLWLLSGSFSWYTTTKTEQMQQLKSLLKTLETNIFIANAISTARASVQQGDRLPIRASLQLEKRLAEAEESLIGQKTDIAKSALDEVVTLQANFLTAANLSALRVELTTDIKKLVGAIGDRDERPVLIKELLTKLKGSQEIPETISTDELLRLERDHHILRVYLCNFEPNLATAANLQKFESLFLQILRTEPSSPRTNLLSSLVGLGSAPEDIAAAISQKSGEIRSLDRVRPYQMVEFQFRFKDPALQMIDAARGLCEYSWIFPNFSSSTSYDRCHHFFAPKWSWRPASWRAKETLNIQVTVRPPFGLGEAESFYQSIALLPKQDRGWGAIGMQIVTFLISFFVAVCTAYGAQYAAALPIGDSLPVWLTAFLLGFGLDQIRDRTTH